MSKFLSSRLFGTIPHTLPESVKNWSALQYIYHGLIHSVSECNIVRPLIIPSRQLLIDLSKSAISHCTCITPMNPHLLFSKSVTASSESTSLPHPCISSRFLVTIPQHYRVRALHFHRQPLSYPQTTNSPAAPMSHHVSLPPFHGLISTMIHFPALFTDSLSKL